MQISVVMPVLNEAAEINASLLALAPLRAAGHEVIVVDGASFDNTVALCEGQADVVVQGPRGRALQMNAGAALAIGDVLLFSHADTRLPIQALAAIKHAVEGGASWGRFDVKISGGSLMFPVIATMMNLRSRCTGIATGDQAIFIKRALFERLGGYADLPLMEDIDLSRRLLAHSRPACLRERVVTSGRRWERDGVWPTVLLMWRLRWRFWRGDAVLTLARSYPFSNSTSSKLPDVSRATDK